MKECVLNYLSDEEISDSAITPERVAAHPELVVTTPGVRGLFELANRCDLQPIRQQLGGLRPHPGELHQLQHPGGNRPTQLLQRGDGPRGKILGDLRSEVLPDAGELVEPVLGGGAL